MRRPDEGKGEGEKVILVTVVVVSTERVVVGSGRIWVNYGLGESKGQQADEGSVVDEEYSW